MFRDACRMEFLLPILLVIQKRGGRKPRVGVSDNFCQVVITTYYMYPDATPH